jgi:hypothetical protein
LDIVAISLDVEGVVCEEQEGRANVYITLLLHGARVWGLATMVSKLRGPESGRMSLHTPASSYIPDVSFPSPSSHLKKRGEKGAKK